MAVLGMLRPFDINLSVFSDVELYRSPISIGINSLKQIFYSYYEKFSAFKKLKAAIFLASPNN
jgi:hypothetical protein